MHQGNLRIPPAPSNLTKYTDKTLCTKPLLSRGVTGKTFTDTEKKNKKNTKLNTDSNWFAIGNPVKKLKSNVFYNSSPYGARVISVNVLNIRALQIHLNPITRVQKFLSDA